MFERFTSKARHVVVLSQEEARRLRHNYIGTEHILLGLLGEPEGVACSVLGSFGMSPDGVRQEILAMIGEGQQEAPSRIPFTPRAKKTLELALREALQLRHSYIGTEHVLLGLIREGEGVAAQVMRAHADLLAIRLAVLDAVPAGAPSEGSRMRGWLRRVTARPFDPGAQAGQAALNATPAADATLTEAANLAGTRPVGSHHLLLAALADEASAAAKALVSLGVNLDRARDALRGVDVAGTSDEQPEEAGRRKMSIRVSGDTVTVETLTQHASDDAARMIEGDADAEAVFRWSDAGKAIDRRGAGPLDASIYGRGAGEGFGVHILTGPIMIEQAMPGDIVEVEILDIAPRPSRGAGFEGRSFGSNAASWWGRQYDDLLTGPRPREIVTIYEITECAGEPCAHAAYRFRWTPQRDPAGVMHETIDYPGVPVDPATIRPQHDILTDIHIPLRLHFGTIALAPDHPGPVDSVPPSCFGGNIDNWRLGAGSRIFLPVAVAGALLSIGDPHAAQGDGEISGTALECSLTGTIRIRLHPRAMADRMLRDLTYPLIETPESWVIQGFSEPDYLTDLGAGAQSDVYRRASLDTAWRDAFQKARRFLMSAHGLDEDEAISLLSVAVDFGITQVVDGNWGVHAIVPKALFKRRLSHS